MIASAKRAHARRGPPDERRAQRDDRQRRRPQHRRLEARHRREQQHDQRPRRRARPEAEPPQQRPEQRERERDVLARHREQVRQPGVAVREHDVGRERPRVSPSRNPASNARDVGASGAVPRSTTSRSALATRSAPRAGSSASTCSPVEAPDRVPPPRAAVEPVRVERAEPARDHDAVAGLEHPQPQRVVAGRDREQRAMRAARSPRARTRRCRRARFADRRRAHREIVTGARRAIAVGERRVRLAVERALGLRAAEQRERDDREREPGATADEPRAAERDERHDQHERSPDAGPARSPRHDPEHEPAERQQHAAFAHLRPSRGRAAARADRRRCPGTRVRSSTLRNGPLRSRSCTIAAGERRADARQRLELLGGRGVDVDRRGGSRRRCRGRPPTDRPRADRSPRRGRPPAAAAPTRGTATRAPSLSLAARLSRDRSAPAVAPPAARIASITRALAGRLTTPGARTAPTTSTTMRTGGGGRRAGRRSSSAVRLLDDDRVAAAALGVVGTCVADAEADGAIPARNHATPAATATHASTAAPTRASLRSARDAIREVGRARRRAGAERRVDRT